MDILTGYIRMKQSHKEGCFHIYLVIVALASGSSASIRIIGFSDSLTL